MKRVLFVCAHNSGRSQMAEAFAGRLGKGKLEAQSAGTEPAERLNPAVVQAMSEIGYYMADQHPKRMTLKMVEWADLVVTMGCGVDSATCPASLVPSEDWGLDDPHSAPIEEVREIRNEIERRIRELAARS